MAKVANEAIVLKWAQFNNVAKVANVAKVDEIGQSFQKVVKVA